VQLAATRAALFGHSLLKLQQSRDRNLLPPLSRDHHRHVT
jgi:hypothetical protein